MEKFIKIEVKYVSEMSEPSNDSAASTPYSLEHRIVLLRGFIGPQISRRIEQGLVYPETLELSVGFVDIEGFTTRTVEHHLDNKARGGSIGAQQITQDIASFLDAAFGIIDRYGGSPIASGGDSILYVTNLMPDKYSAEKLIKIFLDIQEVIRHGHERIRDINIRGGGATGEVVTLLAGKAGVQQQFTTLGYIVNLAKRFESASKAGEMTICERTLELLKQTERDDSFFITQLPDKLYPKGFERFPQTAYVVSGLRRQSGRLTRVELTRDYVFVGRQYEKDQVRDYVYQVVAGTEASLLLVRGRSGYGKTTLVEEAIRDITKVHRLKLTCEENSAAYSGLTDILAEILGTNLGDVRQKLQLFQSSSTVTLDQDQLLPYIGLILNKEFAGYSVSEEPNERQKRIFETFSAIFEAYSNYKLRTSEERVVLVIDDSQYLDKASRDGISLLRDHTLRPAIIEIEQEKEQENASAVINHPYKILKVDKISDDDILAIVRNHVGQGYGRISTDGIEIILSRAEGSPKSAVETGLWLRRRLSELAVEHGGLENVREIPLDIIMAIPVGVKNQVRQKIATLDKATQYTYALAALLAGPRNYCYLDDLRSLGAGELDVELGVRYRILSPEKKTPGSVELLHRIDKEVLVELFTDEEERRSLEGRAAEVILSNARRLGQEDDVLDIVVYHLERGNDPKAAVPYLRKVVDRNLNLGDINGAKAAARRSRELFEVIPAIVNVDESISGICNALSAEADILRTFDSDFAAARDHYFQEAAVISRLEESVQERRVANFNNIAITYFRCDDYTNALRFLKDALAVCGNRKTEGAFKTHLNIGDVYEAIGEHIRIGRLPVDFKVEPESEETVPIDYISQAIREFEKAGRIINGIKAFEKARGTHDEAKYELMSSKVHTNLGICYLSQKRYGKALEEHFESLKISKNNRSRIEFKEAICLNYNSIGFVYMQHATDIYSDIFHGKEPRSSVRINEVIGLYETALGYHWRAYELSKKHKIVQLQVDSATNIAFDLVQIGDKDIADIPKLIDLAKSYLREAMEAAQSVERDKEDTPLIAKVERMDKLCQLNLFEN